MSRPAPPPPLAPKPGEVKVLRALYSYTSQGSDELSFEEGDLLYIVDQASSKDWWKAKAGGKIGLVPSNYVSENAESVDNPLHAAAKFGNIDFLEECISNQVSVNGLDKSGSTPLHWACHGGHIDCIKALLKARCKVDVQNKLGDTPLHSAAWKNRLEVIQLLLEHNARADKRNNDNKLPYDLAHDPACKSLLESKSLSMEGYGDEEDSD